ncbi:MAG: hypothetical protein HY894_06870 [Deltaproteobacteria bacterium]|nr:hypothetical protein [Deltaproteobacteria bacterium]
MRKKTGKTIKAMDVIRKLRKPVPRPTATHRSKKEKSRARRVRGEAEE